MVVLVSPLLREHLHLPEGIKDLPVQELIPQLAIEALYVPVLPRATWPDEEGLDTHPRWSHERTALAVNSGPLSERRCSGTPRSTMRSPRQSMTCGERNERPTWMARHSLVYSSTTVRRRTGLPSRVRRATKSYAHTWFCRCGLRRTQEPSVNQSLPRLGCLAGTLSPSRRQIRSTRLWFTLHPSRCSIALTRRYP